MSRIVKSLIYICIFSSTLFAAGASTDSAAGEGTIMLLSIEGPIGPATEDYVQRALQRAQHDRAALVVIRMDTPGGLDSAMRGIIKSISNSYVPVASFVAPSGARAASAGTYILYASHIAAMAPGTNLGAATPVRMGGVPGGAQQKPDESAMQHKIRNDAVAYIRGLAAMHGRNADWAERAVTEAASLPAEQALAEQVIDLVADNLPDLLRKLDGREIKLMGEERTLHTRGRAIEEMSPDWRSDLLSALTNPNIAYILMLIGIYGLIFEFSSPGAGIPGVVGAICLLLALYAFHMLPISFAGLSLLLLGVALMVGEAFVPSFGVLGIGGAVAFVIGSIILMDTEAPAYGIDLSVIAVFTLSSAVMFIFVIGMAVKARKRPVMSGIEEMLGSEGIVVDDFDQTGKIKVHGELWSAITQQALHKGQQVRVIGIKGLTLEVAPLVSNQTEEPA